MCNTYLAVAPEYSILHWTLAGRTKIFYLRSKKGLNKNGTLRQMKSSMEYSTRFGFTGHFFRYNELLDGELLHGYRHT